MPKLTLHVLPLSHPSKTAEAALRLKGLEFELAMLEPGVHNEQMVAIYGEGNHTVPGLLIDDEPVHGSLAILERIEQLAPEPSLYPAEIADAVREAERWGDEQLQDLGRRLPWAALYFRPEAFGSFGGAGPLDPAGVDFAIRYARASWKYHRITAQQLAEDLAGLPAKLDHIDALAADGIVDRDTPTAADLQIGATVGALLTVGDLRPLFGGRAAERLAQRWFPAAYSGDIPPGAYPAGWVPKPLNRPQPSVTRGA